jgi:hypothetical protein
MTLFFCCLSLYSRNKTCTRYCFNRWWSFEFYWRWVVAVDAWETVELNQTLSEMMIPRIWQNFEYVFSLRGVMNYCSYWQPELAPKSSKNFKQSKVIEVKFQQGRQKPSKGSQSFMSFWVEVLNICTSSLPYFTAGRSFIVKEAIASAAGHLIISHRTPKFP